MLAKGCIKANISLYGVPVFFAKKKTKKLKIYIDFRAPNTNTRLDIFPLLGIADLLDKLDKARNDNSIDLVYAYH